MTNETTHPAFYVNGDRTGPRPSQYTLMVVPEKADHSVGAHIANADLLRQKLKDNNIPFEDDGNMGIGAHTVIGIRDEANRPVTRLEIRALLPAAQAWNRLKKAGFIPRLPSYH